MSFFRGDKESRHTKKKKNNNNKNNNSDDGGGSQHNNSQHVLAIVAYEKPHSRSSIADVGSTIDEESVLRDFSKTSAKALPIETWRHDYETNRNGNNDASTSYVILASNYPNCILESEHFCVLSAGFPYHYQAAFGEESSSKASNNNKSFSRTVLDYCEALHRRRQTRTKEEEGAAIGVVASVDQRLKKVSGHFSLFLVRKQTRSGKPGGFWAWNDPFGFLPVYHHHHRLGGSRHANTKKKKNESNKYENSNTILSSHWDCIVPAICSLRLDWDVVAEYLTLGTTLGGRRTNSGSSSSSTFCLDRTLVKHIENFRPGTRLSIEAPAIASEVKNGLLPPPTITMKSYIDCYGACEEILLATFLEKTTTTSAAADLPMGYCPSSYERMPKNNNYHSIRGVKLAETKKDKKNLMVSPLTSSKGIETMDNHINNCLDSSTTFLLTLVLDAIFAAILSCIEAAVVQGHVGRAALTGGGDTRLILACLLLLQGNHQHRHQKDSKAKQSTIVFQTHSKQKTDWQIARHLATLFGLKHEQIRATSTTIEGAYDLASLFSREEDLLSNLHDQTPLRRKQKKKIDKHKEHKLSYTLHGRFGTEFLGCLCFDKSPLDVRSHEIEELRPKATKWFRLMFVSTVIDWSKGTKTTIRNPIDTLQERFDELEEDKTALEKKAKNTDSKVAFDVSYAFQLQLYTRSCLCDIYKGLRGGSWFSIPTAQFTRNAITPFLDNTLLRLLLCLVSIHDKEEPYELYGKLYSNNKIINMNSNSNSNSDIMDILRKVPSNNKLLCNHTSIPRAIKAPEAKARPFVPKQLRSTKKCPSRKHVLEKLQHQFHPVFWKGAVAIFETAPVKMDAKLVQEDSRPEVRAFVELVGNASDACLLSGRLQSFLLWHERRFLCHIPRGRHS